MNPIHIHLNNETIQLDRRLYRLLFESSTVHSLVEYKKTLTARQVSFGSFVKLARRADIPYVLFLAPEHVIVENLDRKMELLLSGVTKGTFSMNSRGSVEIRDIELIIKDILRKQELLKSLDDTIPDNTIMNLLKRSRKSVKEQAVELRSALDIDLNVVAGLNKTKTFDYLVSLFEKKNIFVSQSVRSFMPQIIQPAVKFSGICIKDKKVPFIFLNNKEDGEIFEPEGRKILTLLLLAICLAKGKFMALSYNEQSKSKIQDIEFSILEELFLPMEIIQNMHVGSLDKIEECANTLSVTPSAFIMRLRHLDVIDDELASNYLTELKVRFTAIPKSTARNPKPERAFTRYNGPAYTKAIISLMDAGKITRSDAGRILFTGKEKPSFIETLRSYV